jgi:hypothetical protein
MDPEIVVVAETPPSQPPPTLASVDGETIVAVAEIEAARDVAIAGQHTEQTQIMADAVSAEEQEDIAWLKETLADLRGLCETNAGELSNLRTALLTTQDQLQQTAEQVAALTAAAITQAENNPPPLTPEPVSPPPDPSNEDGDAPATPTGEQDPPTGNAPPAGKRRRVWLR